MPPSRLLVPLGLLLVLGGVLLVDHLVVTDEEAIEALVDEAAAAARRGDFEALRGLLAPEYHGEGGSRDGAIRRAERARALEGDQGLSAQVLELAVEGDRARGPVKVSGALPGGRAVSLDVSFVRLEDGWRIAGARITGAMGGLWR